MSSEPNGHRAAHPWRGLTYVFRYPGGNETKATKPSAETGAGGGESERRQRRIAASRGSGGRDESKETK